MKNQFRIISSKNYVKRSIKRTLRDLPIELSLEGEDRSLRIEVTNNYLGSVNLPGGVTQNQQELYLQPKEPGKYIVNIYPQKDNNKNKGYNLIGPIKTNGPLDKDKGIDFLVTAMSNKIFEKCSLVRFILSEGTSYQIKDHRRYD